MNISQGGRPEECRVNKSRIFSEEVHEDKYISKKIDGSLCITLPCDDFLLQGDPGLFQPSCSAWCCSLGDKIPLLGRGFQAWSCDISEASIYSGRGLALGNRTPQLAICLNTANSPCLASHVF